MARNGWVTSDGDPEFRMNPELLRGPTVLRRDADEPDVNPDGQQSAAGQQQ